LELSLQKINLLSLNRENLNKFFTDLGEKPYRTKQITSWIYHKSILDFDLMLDISKNLREKLKILTTLDIPKIAKIDKSSDGVLNWIIALDDNNHIETVFIPEKNRGTLCISTQVGCALDCSFCATGKQGFNRNLTTDEIISQVLIAKHHGVNVTNIVFMGMGEPLLNETPVYDTCSMLLDDYFFGISRRKVTISTSGVVPAMERMIEKTNVSLAISLHATNDKLRDELVPVNKKYNIEKLLKTCQKYIDYGEQKRHILFEYVMLKGVNDSVNNAKELAILLKNINAKVNLIPFNSFKESDYEVSDRTTIDTFQNILTKSGILTTTRKTRGDDVAGACGQLAGKVKNKRGLKKICKND
jgi:23S rRNA (adenine2503-C2)-methyltransferase